MGGASRPHRVGSARRAVGPCRRGRDRPRSGPQAQRERWGGTWRRSSTSPRCRRRWTRLHGRSSDVWHRGQSRARTRWKTAPVRATRSASRTWCRRQTAARARVCRVRRDVCGDRRDRRGGRAAGRRAARGQRTSRRRSRRRQTQIAPLLWDSQTISWKGIYKTYEARRH